MLSYTHLFPIIDDSLSPHSPLEHQTSAYWLAGTLGRALAAVIGVIE
jgi:hypothetical protein